MSTGARTPGLGSMPGSPTKTIPGGVIGNTLGFEPKKWEFESLPGSCNKYTGGSNGTRNLIILHGRREINDSGVNRLYLFEGRERMEDMGNESKKANLATQYIVLVVAIVCGFIEKIELNMATAIITGYFLADLLWNTIHWLRSKQPA